MLKFALMGSTIICTPIVVAKISEQTSDAQIESYINGLESLSAGLCQRASNSDDIHKGHIYIKRGGNSNKTKVFITYDSGTVLSMSLKGRVMTIIDRKTRTPKRYSILTTPIYAILTGELNLKDLKHTKLKESDECVTIRITYEKQFFDLSFSKKNGKLNGLLAWTVHNSNSWIHTEFNTSNYYENDASKVPDSLFEENNVNAK